MSPSQRSERCYICGGSGRRSSFVLAAGREMEGECPDCEGTGVLPLRPPTVIKRARQAALEPYTDAPQTTDEWLDALRLGADAAVRIVLDSLIDCAKTGGDRSAVVAMYVLEAELGEQP